MAEDRPDNIALKLLEDLRRDFEAAAARARGLRGKALRAWFTGEEAGREAEDCAVYARRLKAAGVLLEAGGESEKKIACALLTRLKREFRAVAKVHRSAPPPGMGAKTLAVYPEAGFLAHPKAAQYQAYAARLDAILKAVK